MFYLLYCCLAINISDNAPLWGDEPHYLFIAYSLAQDGDLELSNNLKTYQENVLIRYLNVDRVSGQQFRPHRAPQSPRGKIYSHHDFGLPLLISPAVYIGIYFNNVRLSALLVICLVAVGFLYNLLHLLSSEMQICDRYAWIVTIATGLSFPTLIYATQIYSELLAALLITYALRQVLFLTSSNEVANNSERMSRLGLLKFVLSCVLLVFTHIKYAAIVGLLTLFYLTQKRLYKEYTYKELAYFFALPAFLGLFLWSYSFYIRFGTFWPMGGWQGKNIFSLSELHIKFIAFFIDRHRGILIYSPYLLICGWGTLSLWSNKNLRVQVLWLIVLGFSLIALHIAHVCWWAGICPPGRYFLPVLPFASLVLVHSLRSLRSRSAVVIFYTALAITLVNSFVLICERANEVVGGVEYKIPYLLWGRGGNFELTGYYGISSYCIDFIFKTQQKQEILLITCLWGLGLISLYCFINYREKQAK